MKMSNNDKFEKLLNDLYQEIKVPDSQPSWSVVEIKLRKRKQRKKVIRRIQMVTGFACASIIISLLIAITNSNNSQAYASLSSFWKNIQNNVVEVFLKKPEHNSDSALTSSPPSEEHTNFPNVIPEKTTLEEAQNKLDFSVLLPTLLPEQFNLTGVRIFKESDDQYRSIYLEYTNQQGTLVKMTERLLTDNTGVKTEIYEGTGEIKDVYINEHPAILMLLQDGMLNLEWIVGDIKLSLSGILSESEAIDWAKSVR